jgi:hypothetical protein
MCAVSPAAHSFSDFDFARAISRKFEHGRFLIVGAAPQKLQAQFAEAEREAEVWSYDELASKLTHDRGKARFETRIWFYPSGTNDDERVAEALARHAERIILMPGPGADAARRRPRLVECFGRFGFLPDYECDLLELDPGAVCLRRLPRGAGGEAVATVERAFARLNRQLGALRRTFEIRCSELEAAQRHIAALEEKLLKLKEYRRELKLLRKEKQLLRKSAERRIGQIFFAPYRLPEKLAKTVWKKFHLQKPTPPASTALSGYQKWLEQHRASAQELKQMRDEARTFSSQPLISVITPVFDTPVQRLEKAVE